MRLSTHLSTLSNCRPLTAALSFRLILIVISSIVTSGITHAQTLGGTVSSVSGTSISLFALAGILTLVVVGFSLQEDSLLARRPHEEGAKQHLLGR